MHNTIRFQVDVTSKEHKLMEQLAQLAGLRTKKELFSSALTLFKWAARERLQGRIIASIDNAKNVKEFEMPALSEIANECPMLSPEEFKRRLAEPIRPFSDVASEVQRKE